MEAVTTVELTTSPAQQNQPPALRDVLFVERRGMVTLQSGETQSTPESHTDLRNASTALPSIATISQLKKLHV